MSYISKRVVKGTIYYYLDESIRANKKLFVESIYLGSELPSNEKLFEAFNKLKKKCDLKKHVVLVPPLTEFIATRTAKNLLLATVKKKKFLKEMTKTNGYSFIRERKEF